MCVSTALSIDYALFMLMRYREALDSGIPHRKAVDVMLLSAGKTVLVSGGTLTLCFVAFCFIPVPILVAVGAASSLALGESRVRISTCFVYHDSSHFLCACVSECVCAVVTMTTYFTLSPLLLLLFPNFFAKVRPHAPSISCRPCSPLAQLCLCCCLLLSPAVCGAVPLLAPQRLGARVEQVCLFSRAHPPHCHRHLR